MAGFFDGATIKIPCANCNRETEKSIGWIKTHGEFTCVCGTIIHLETKDMRRELGKAERRLAELTRDINITIKL